MTEITQRFLELASESEADNPNAATMSLVHDIVDVAVYSAAGCPQCARGCGGLATAEAIAI